MMQSCRELSQDLPGCKRHIVKGCSARLCVALVCGAGAAGWFGRGAPSTASDSRPARWLRIAYPAGEPLPGWLPVASTVSEPALHALERIGLRADCDARSARLPRSPFAATDRRTGMAERHSAR